MARHPHALRHVVKPLERHRLTRPSWDNDLELAESPLACKRRASHRHATVLIWEPPHRDEQSRCWTADANLLVVGPQTRQMIADSGGVPLPSLFDPRSLRIAKGVGARPLELRA